MTMDEVYEQYEGYFGVELKPWEGSAYDPTDDSLPW